jgi:hypothetical protein
MSKTPKKHHTPPSIIEPVTEFEVDSGGTLKMAGFQEAETRADFYEDVANDWSCSPQALSDAMDRCQPLAWAVHSIYTDLRDELSADVLEAQSAGSGQKRRLTALKARLRAMPEEPEVGAEAWLLALTTREFDDWVTPEIEKWFDSEPAWSFEDDYLPQTGTAQGAAMEFFQSMDADKVEVLGVVIVEGEHPGSSYYAAELTGEIDLANKAAADANIPVRFKARKIHDALASG